MPSDEVWGDEALGAVLASVTSVPPPSQRQTPLEQEVDALTARADAAGAGSEILANPGGGWFARLAVVMVDAVLARDKRALDALDVELRRVHRQAAAAEHVLPPEDGREHDSGAAARGRVCAQLSLEFVRAALERVAPVAAAAKIAGTQREHFLRVLASRPGLNSRQMAEALGAYRADASDPSTRPRPLDASQLSKMGKQLLRDGLVFAQRGKSGLSWELTPRGRLAIDPLLEAHEDSDHPVNSVVITSGASQAKNIIAVLSTSKPQEVQVVGTEHRITYRRQDAAAVRGRIGAAPVSVEMAVAGLLDTTEPRPPQSFSLDDDVRYNKLDEFSLV